MEKSRWHQVKEKIRKAIGSKRNNGSSRVRASLLNYMEVHGVDSVDLSKVLEGRKNPESFRWFLDVIASVVVGVQEVNQMKSVKPPCEWLSSSLEAFCLLCLENCFDQVKSEARGDAQKPETKWTKEGRGSRKNQGWQQDGIRRYNELVESVRLDRAALRKEDENYLRIKQEERLRYENERLLKRQKTTDGREQDLLTAMDDFSSDSECDSDSDSD